MSCTPVGALFSRVVNGLSTAGDYRNITMYNHKQYANAHGYDYRVLTSPFKNGITTNLSDVRWHKSFMVKFLLATYNWVFWTDCDSLFMNFSMPLPIPKTNAPNSPHFIFCGDHNNAINTGQFLIDNSTWSRSLLDQIHMNKHAECGDKFDNAAFNWVLWKNCAVSRSSVTTMSQCQAKIKVAVYPWALGCASFNTYPDVFLRLNANDRRTVFRVHFPGDQHKKLTYANQIQQYVIY